MLSRAMYRNRYLRRQDEVFLPISAPITMVDYIENYDEQNQEKNKTYRRYKKLFRQVEYLPGGFEKYVNEVMQM
jgi:hypothetical protein